jgi:hypothetical protein
MSYSKYAILLTTVASQQFVEAFVEPDGRDFLVFGSTIKSKGSIVEPTINALRAFTSGSSNVWLF